ncbi:MAG: VWA domain-containing protein [Hyphomicrobiales bacterium]
MNILSRYMLPAMFCGVALTTTISLSGAQSVDDKAIIVFDASGSMWGQIGGKSKIEIARDTLDGVVKEFPPELQLGLIAYGHNRKGDCGDIQTMVEIGPASVTGARIAQTIRKISPKGKTPLSDAVMLAAETLRYTEDKATVILVTDGIETCNADPCALGNLLEQNGINFTTHVVGFGLSAEEGRQVSCLADNTGGLYLPADNADELADALGKTVTSAPPTEPEETPKRKPKHNLNGQITLVEGSEPLPIEATNGVAWSIQKLDDQGNAGAIKNISREHAALWSGEPGKYLLSVEYRFGGKTSQIVELKEYEVTNVSMPLNAARVMGAGAFMRDDFGIDWSVLEWKLINVDTKQRQFLYGETTDVILPAGTYEISHGLRGEKPSVNPPRTVQLQAGDVKPINFILPNSEVTINALEADGTRNMSIRQAYKLRNEDGSAGETILYDASAKPVFLRPGKYIVSIELWDRTKRKPVEIPIDIGLGERHSFEVRLP